MWLSYYNCSLHSSIYLDRLRNFSARDQSSRSPLKSSKMTLTWNLRFGSISVKVFVIPRPDLTVTVSVTLWQTLLSGPADSFRRPTQTIVLLVLQMSCRKYSTQYARSAITCTNAAEEGTVIASTNEKYNCKHCISEQDQYSYLLRKQYMDPE